MIKFFLNLIEIEKNILCDIFVNIVFFIVRFFVYQINLVFKVKKIKKYQIF